MRIIAGKFKGRRLKSPKGLATRPTAARVKESLFRILGARVVEADFLDLCAGAGNVGLEALSQGAKSVTFIDSNYHSIRVIESNLELCGLTRKHPKVKLICLDAQKGLLYLAKHKAKFNLIYFDPPYDADIYEPCLTLIARRRLLADSGLMVVERRKVKGEDEQMRSSIGGLIRIRREEYGDAVLSFYEWEKTQ
jgi:16S rRNA (guanine(966)-N(2))-methyltransferase RsmD